MKPTNIQEHKKVSQSKVIIKDIENILQVVDKALKGFYLYKNYTPVAEILATIENNKTMLEIHLKKHKRMIEYSKE